MLPDNPASLVLIFLSITAVGLAKGGLAGIGMVGMPLMAMVFPPIEAAAILMPVLILQDAFGFWIYRRDWNASIIVWMMPGVVLGVATAALSASMVSAQAILVMLGIISIGFGLWRLRADHHQLPSGPFFRLRWPGLIFGFFSGFTSQVAHAGAPPFQMWVMPKRLPHRTYAGTNIALFAMTNWIKVPAFIALDAFTHESLILSAQLMPLALVTTFLGAWAVSRVSGPRFYTIASGLLVLVGVGLLWEALGKAA